VTAIERSRNPTDVASGDLRLARADAESIRLHADTAHDLTTGPVWAAAAAVPVLGDPLDTTRAQVNACVEIARRAGMDFLVLDQTRPDVEVPVVRVIVPGLRHFYRRFGPGRLYDVPVKLGLRDRPLAEHELNPLHPQT